MAQTGFVRALSIRYRTADDGAQRYGFEYTDVGSTTVDRPGWVRERWPNATTADSRRIPYDTR